MRSLTDVHTEVHLNSDETAWLGKKSEQPTQSVTTNLSTELKKVFQILLICDCVCVGGKI